MSKRVAGYLRVSTQGQAEEGFSIPAQRRAITLYCEAQGWEVPEIFADEGLSARSDDLAKRPAFATMLDAVDEGRFDVVIVHRLDRFARNLITTMETLRRIERAGAGFISISESMDFSSAIGKVILATLAAFAQYYSDNLSTETKKGKAERKRQGMYNGLLPFGVTTDNRGIPVADTMPWACNIATRQELVPVDGLRLAYQLAAQGASDRDVAIALTRAGYRTSGNRGQNPFTKDTVRPILQNRFYLGELPDGDDWLPGKHAAILEPELFDAVQQKRGERAWNRASVRRDSRTRALSGMLRCAACGAPMRVQSGQYYRCSAGHQSDACDQPGVRIDDLDAQVAQLIRMFNVPEGMMHMFLAEIRLADQPAVRDTTRERSRITTRLTRLKELYLEGDIAKDDYRRQRVALQAELDALPVPSYEPTGEERLREIGRYLSNLSLAWSDATDDERNAIVRELFSCIYVGDREAVAVVPRPALAAYVVPLVSGLTAHRRKRRGTVTHLRYLHGDAGAVVIPPLRANGAKQGRYGVTRRRAKEPATDAGAWGGS